MRTNHGDDCDRDRGDDDDDDDDDTFIRVDEELFPIFTNHLNTRQQCTPLPCILFTYVGNPKLVREKRAYRCTRVSKKMHR